ncbi:putative alpha-1,6-mannosyltransferase mnn11 [Lodderomyces elongisporus]|uniref:putative alpha-1,6-mannosyltransferase mnn11 n=1 Tax=Lodderomyces elongisporus TaxID=36914 RepID=UPI00291E7856|nr:putative alpha-1,6-mannosyltransferase mnn11 [Lodderomyces elongisporus]WLF77874.1 putative alpha-1,6-mannosyltransferase mnn11 [Lodderomyces elongisporus]
MFHNSNKKNVFKPRYDNSQSFLPLPATFSRINNKRRLPLVIVGLILIWFFFNPLAFLSSHLKTSKIPQYPPAHPYSTKHIVETSSRFIFPPIEHAPLLKQLGAAKLVATLKLVDSDRVELRPLTLLENENFEIQQAKERDENAKDTFMKAKNTFKNQDRVVYKPKPGAEYPDVVIVTVVDFDRYSLDGLSKIVQNRVDYAHFNKYGIYVRWKQEFTSQLGSLAALDDVEKSKWTRLFALEAAMLAFPESSWFWYLDEDALIMDLNSNLNKQFLSAEILNQRILRDQPLIPPDGLIKTYKSTKPQNVKLILTQSDSKIETNSFLIKNDKASEGFGKALVQIWSNSLYMNYQSFPYGPDSALTHILQWHPFVLSKTAIIPGKVIAASHDIPKDDETKEGGKEKVGYEDGDFVVQWSSCKTAQECETILNIYHSKLKPSKR